VGEHSRTKKGFAVNWRVRIEKLSQPRKRKVLNRGEGNLYVDIEIP
jgi:hypothetical protein